MKYNPIALNLYGKTAMIAGGGVVAERKVFSLLGCNARISVIAPTLTAGLAALARKDRIKWKKRRVCDRDLRGADIVIAATNDIEVNHKISKWARKERSLVNVVDNPVLSDFISPAVFRKGKAIVAVYTDGKDPVLSRDLKNFVKENWDVFLSYRNRLQKRKP